jgi:hypothetical protein
MAEEPKRLIVRNEGFNVLRALSDNSIFPKALVSSLCLSSLDEFAPHIQRENAMRSKVLKWIFVLLVLCQAGNTFPAEIATCRNPQGYSYFHHSKLTPKGDAGWQTDSISSGLTTLQRLDDGKYDLLLVDVRKKIISLRQDGGEVLLIRRGREDATFLHIHPGMVVEMYTFWTDAEGHPKYDLIQSKGGDGMSVHKSSVLIGDCDEINFDLIK